MCDRNIYYGEIQTYVFLNKINNLWNIGSKIIIKIKNRYNNNKDTLSLKSTIWGVKHTYNSYHEGIRQNRCARYVDIPFTASIHTPKHYQLRRILSDIINLLIHKRHYSKTAASSKCSRRGKSSKMEKLILIYVT